ncbi:MAG: hypothetical protein KBS55_03045 [Bacteroidales bacterium]|nr:hypothetical protein [Candidatus Cryptobacteroides aphodequi]
MKHNQLLMLAAIAAAAFCSCNPEAKPSGNGGNTGGKEKTFTAAAPTTKSTFDAGSYYWEAGDIIYIASSAADATINGDEVKGAVKVVLTDEMLSSDKRTAYISAKVPEGVDMYYAYSVGKDANLLKSVTKAGLATFAAVDHSDAAAKTGAFAACLGSNSKLNFNSMLVPVSFSVEEPVYKAVLQSLNGETLTDEFTVDVAGKVALTGKDVKTSVTTELGDSTTAYFFLAPGITLNGYKVSFYSDETTLAFEKENPSVLQTAKGENKKLGSFSADSKSHLYYEEWEAGKDIDICGKIFNKTKNSNLTAVHVTAAETGGVYTLPEAIENTIICIDPDVQVTISGANTFSGTVVICGNNSDMMTTATMTNQMTAMSETANFYMKNLDFESTYQGDKKTGIFTFNPNATAADNKLNLYIDDSKIKCAYGAPWFVLQSIKPGIQANFDEFIITDTKWEVKYLTAEQRKTYDRHGTGNKTWGVSEAPNQNLISIWYYKDAASANVFMDFGRIVLDNDIFYCPDGINQLAIIFDSYAQAERNHSFKAFQMTNCTCLNLTGYLSGNNKGSIGCMRGVRDTLDIAYDIFYNEVDWGDSYLFLYRTDNSTTKTTLNEGGYFRIGTELTLHEWEENGVQKSAMAPDLLYEKGGTCLYYGTEKANTATEPDYYDGSETPWRGTRLVGAWLTGCDTQYCWCEPSETNPFSSVNVKEATYERKKAFKNIGATL